MSHSHRDRYKWKRKERNRSGKSDTPNIKRHRERVVAHVEERTRERRNYQLSVFQTRLEYGGNRDAGWTTTVVMHGKTLEQFDYPIEEVTDCHWVLTREKNDFNLSAEKRALDKHVNRIRFTDKRCHLQQANDRAICNSAIPCKYRVWDAERQVPLCKIK